MYTYMLLGIDIYTYMCAYMWMDVYTCRWVQMHAHVELGERLQVASSIARSPLWYLRQLLSLNMELSNSARLASRRLWGPGFGHMPQCLALSVGLGTDLGLLSLLSKLPTGPSPQPHHRHLKFSNFFFFASRRFFLVLCGYKMCPFGPHLWIVCCP